MTNPHEANDVNILDLAADEHGLGPPHALGRRLPAMITELLQAADISARHGSSTIPVDAPEGEGSGLAWAVPAGLLDEGKAIDLSRRTGAARLLVFGELGPQTSSGMTLKIRVLRREDAAEVARLEKDFFEEEAAQVAQAVAKAVAAQLDRVPAIEALEPAQVLGTNDSKALILLQEGLDGVVAAEGGLIGADLGAALERLLAALEQDPDCRRARDLTLSALAGGAESALGLELAAELAGRLLELRPDDPIAAQLMARLSRRLRRPTEAKAILEAALERSPRSALLIAELAQLLNERGEHDEAARCAREALESVEAGTSPDEVQATLHEALGLALARQGSLESALDHLSRAVELDGDNRSHAWANIGRCDHLLRRFDAARRAYERSLEIAPNDWEVIRNSAELLVELGDLETAEERLQRWAELRPNDPMAALALSELLTSRGRPVEAVELLEGAIEAHPNDPRLQALRGGIQTQLGDHEGAEASYREALRLDPDAPELLSNLAVILSHRGALPEAEVFARRACELAPEDTVARRVLEHIRSRN